MSTPLKDPHLYLYGEVRPNKGGVGHILFNPWVTRPYVIGLTQVGRVIKYQGGVGPFPAFLDINRSFNSFSF